MIGAQVAMASDNYTPGALLLALSMLAACLPNPGGANRGARAPGSGHGGVEIDRRELAVSPDGGRVVYRVGDRVRALDLASGEAREIQAPQPLGLLAFEPGRRGFYLKSRARKVEHEPPAAPTYEEQVAAFDGDGPAPRWSVTLPRYGGGLTPLASGVALWGTDGMELLDSSSGARRWAVAPEGVPVDVDEVGGSLLLTEAPVEDGKPNPGHTVLRLIDAANGQVTCRLSVNNCTDEVAVTKDGHRAFLAPTFCGDDPVSVIDLRRCVVDRTLPGFGPVALAAGGRWAVAFADREARADAALLPASIKGSKRRYHLLRIDPASLAYEGIELGDWLPRYATVGAGSSLLVDTGRSPPVQLRMVDLEQRSVAVVPGPAVPLSAYAVPPDGGRVFVLLNGLYTLRPARPQLDSVPLPFLPVALNLTPDGQTLLLRDDEDRVYLMDAATLEIKRTVAP